MKFVRTWLACAWLIGIAATARAQDPVPATLPAMAQAQSHQYQVYQARLEAAKKLPASLQDMPFIAGIEGNDLVHAETLRQIVLKKIAARDFAALDEMERYFWTSQSRLPGGTWDLSVFHSSIRYALTKDDEEGRCELRGDFVNAWAQHSPAMPGPYLAGARQLVDLAWCLRGPGYAFSVKEDAWKPFRQYLAAAQELLDAHAEIAKQDPKYYALMEWIYTSEGRSDAEFQHLVDDASAHAPYFYEIYFEAADHALPKWGGSSAQVDQVARYAAAHTRAEDGSGAYARVYWYLDDCGCDLSQFSIDGAVLAKAMDNIHSRTPSDWNAANFARIACQLGDRPLMAAQFARGGREDGIEWDDKAEWQRCRQEAGLTSAPRMASATQPAARTGLAR